MDHPRSIESCHHHAQNEFANSYRNISDTKLIRYNINIYN